MRPWDRPRRGEFSARTLLFLAATMTLLWANTPARATEELTGEPEPGPSPLTLELALHYAQVNLTGASGDTDSGVGSSFMAGWRVYDRLYLVASVQFAYNDPADVERYRISPAAGLAYRLDFLPVYPELSLMAGGEFTRRAGAWDIDSSLVISLGLFVEVGAGFSLGMSVGQHLLFSDIRDDPGVFLSLFKSTARMRTIAFALRFDPVLAP